MGGKRGVFAGISIILACALATSHAAAIVETSGGVSYIEPPRSVLEGALEGDDTIWLFPERSTEGGLKSHLFHYDPQGSPRRFKTATGSATFRGPIVDVIGGAYALTETDETYGLRQVSYPQSHWFRGVESVFGDSISIAPDGRTLNIDLVAVARNGIDEIRVLATAPLPPAALLFLSCVTILVPLAFGRSSIQANSELARASSSVCTVSPGPLEGTSWRPRKRKGRRVAQ